MSATTTEVCSRHGVETRLRCASCGTPICLRCQVRTEVGLKCPSCAQPVAIPRSPLRVGRGAAIGAVGLGVVLVAATVLLVTRSGGPTSTTSTSGPAPVGAWKTVPDLSVVRGGTTAVLLPDHRVLVAGGGIGAIPLAGAELYDPQAQRWTRTGDMLQARRGNETVLLADGHVLVTGGIAGSRVLASAEVYDPARGTWSGVSAMHEARFNHVLTVLADGRVLAAGGTSSDGVTALKSAELFDPRAGTWTGVGAMTTARTGARSVLLRDGRVLIAGGASGLDPAATSLDSTELFDPAGRIFTGSGSMRQARADLTLAALADGRVLAAGGASGGDSVSTADLLDPVTGTWSSTGSMAQSRRLHQATLLPSGQVLVTGGEEVERGTRTSLTSAELFDPGSATWKPAKAMSCPRSEQAQVVLADGRVLVVAGDSALPGEPPRAQSCAELFDPAGH